MLLQSWTKELPILVTRHSQLNATLPVPRLTVTRRLLGSLKDYLSSKKRRTMTIKLGKKIPSPGHHLPRQSVRIQPHEILPQSIQRYVIWFNLIRKNHASTRKSRRYPSRSADQPIGLFIPDIRAFYFFRTITAYYVYDNNAHGTSSRLHTVLLVDNGMNSMLNVVLYVTLKVATIYAAYIARLPSLWKSLSVNIVNAPTKW